MEVIHLDFKNILIKKKDNFPSIIELQTQSICNANCIICPYEEISKKYEHKIMSNELIEKIIEECDKNSEKIERIIPYFNNEPSLDKRILQILKRIKKKKKHFIELSTNMSGFSNNDLLKIIEEELVDELRISIFASNQKDYKKIMPNLNFESTIKKTKFLIENNKKIDIKIIMILSDVIDIKKNLKEMKEIFSEKYIETFGFLDRAGSVKVKSNKLIEELFQTRGCSLNRPYERINILATGEVVLCSNDWDREVNIGNVKESSLYDVWNSNIFEKHRNYINGHIEMPDKYICRKCKLLLLEQEKKIILNFLGDDFMTLTDEVKEF